MTPTGLGAEQLIDFAAALRRLADTAGELRDHPADLFDEVTQRCRAELSDCCTSLHLMAQNVETIAPTTPLRSRTALTRSLESAFSCF